MTHYLVNITKSFENMRFYSISTYKHKIIEPKSTKHSLANIGPPSFHVKNCSFA